jgi:TolB-like protein
MDPVSFWHELRRRRVGRVGLAYAAAAFVILQFADIVFPAVGVPQWGMAFLALLAALGFVIAVLLAWVFDITPAGVRRTAPLPTAARGRPRPEPAGRLRRLATHWAPLLLAVGLLLGVTGGYAAYHRLGTDGAAAVDDELLVVLPFRTASPALADLSVGLVELLATTLTGDGGLRAVDAGAVLGRMARAGSSGTVEDALGHARELGAGHVLVGAVVGSGDVITITATVHAVLRRRSYTERVTGHTGELVRLVDELTARVLARHAGDEQLGTVLTGTPLPAVHAHLQGLRMFRTSDFTGSMAPFSRALDIDSTFASAALYLSLAATWETTPSAVTGERALRLAWAHQHRLGPADRLLLQAVVGPNYPDPSSALDRLRAWDQVVQRTPDRALGWFQYGDLILHNGRILEIDDFVQRARHAFNRALELDSTFLAARVHDVDMLLAEGRFDEVRQLLAVQPAGLQFHSPHLSVMYHAMWDSAAAHWLGANLAALTGDELQMLALAPAGMALGWITGIEPFPSAWAEQAITELRGSARNDAERRIAERMAYVALLNAGRPAAAAALVRARRESGAPDLPYELVFDALYWDADAVLAAEAVASIERARAGAAWSAHDTRERDYAACALAHWYLLRGPAERARTWAAATPAGNDAASALRASLCDAMTRVIAAHAEPESMRLPLASLDSMLRTGPAVWGQFQKIGNLVSARAHDALDEPEAAYRATHRLFLGSGISDIASSMLRLRARLAARLGRTEEAVTAYRHYLEWRRDAEPALQPELERVRAELAALAGERY